MLPQTMILFNGLSFPESIIKYFMDKNNVKIITFESAIKENSIIFSKKSAPALDFEFKNQKLSEENKEKINQYLNTRFSGNVKRGDTDYWQNIKPLDDNLLEKINNYKNVISIFLNVPFDTSQVNSSNVFLDMYDWINELIKFADLNKDTYFIFRSHPDEIRPDKKIYLKTSTYISKITKNKENIFVVPSRYSLNSYELISKSDLILVYNSTIALETFLLRKNVLCAANAHYSKLIPYKTPIDKKSYFERVSSLLNSKGFQGEKNYDSVLSYFYQLIFDSSIDFSSIAKKIESTK